MTILELLFTNANYNDIAEYLENWEEEVGEPCKYNYFDNPEALMVCAVIWTVDNLIRDVPCIDDNLNAAEIDLTQEIAEEIKQHFEVLLKKNNPLMSL